MREEKTCSIIVFLLPLSAFKFIYTHTQIQKDTYSLNGYKQETNFIKQKLYIGLYQFSICKVVTNCKQTYKNKMKQNKNQNQKQNAKKWEIT